MKNHKNIIIFMIFLLTIKNLVSSKITSVDLGSDNYYFEDDARKDFDLYLLKLGFR